MSSQPNQPPGKRPTRAKRLWSAIKSPFRWTEERAIEPFANYLDQADIFRIVEKLSPVIEAIGIIAIPLVIWFATESAQEARENTERAARAQEAVKIYLNQLSSIFLAGNLEKDSRLRILTRASTLALLQDPNLKGTHRGRVMEYLSELELIQGERTELSLNSSGEASAKELKVTIISKEPLITLANSNLSGADLSGVDLRGADLRGADLSGANFETINMESSINELNTSFDEKGRRMEFIRGTNLIQADLRGANLSEANLSGTSLRGANLSGANLRRANLNRANLSETNLVGANLNEANLKEADISETDLVGAILCKTALSPSIKLNANRDCRELKTIIPFQGSK